MTDQHEYAAVADKPGFLNSALVGFKKAGRKVLNFERRAGKWLFKLARVA